jgi:hypothetical protein
MISSNLSIEESACGECRCERPADRAVGAESAGAVVGQGDQDADFAFAYRAPEGPRAFVSTIKLRQAWVHKDD